MTLKTKGHTGCHQVTRNSSEIVPMSTGIASRFKATVLTLAERRVLQIFVAAWMSHRGGLRNV